MANGSSNGANGGSRVSWVTVAVTLLLILVAIGAYLQLRPRRIRISAVKANVEVISSSITTNGKVEPIQGFEAHAPQPLTVQKVLVKEGDHVKAGQLLLVLDDARARSDLAVAQSRLKAAEERYRALLSGGDPQTVLSRKADLAKTHTEVDAAQRQLASLQRLQQRGAATADEISVAQDRLSRAQADLAQLQAPVRYSPEQQARAQAEINDAKAGVQFAEDVLHSCDIQAPFDGVVYYLPARTGAFVALGDLLLQEANLSQLQVRAFVDEPEIGRLALGQTVRISWDALPGRYWQGTVATLPSTVTSRGSRVVGELLCKVDNNDHALLPGVNVNAVIVSASRDGALTVPREAVREEGDRRFLFVVEGNHLRKHEVKIGISNLTRVEILSGINSGDLIGVQSYSPSPMTDGIEVKIAENPS